MGHILGGWTVSPLFTASSGAHVSVGYSVNAGGTYEAFGSIGAPGTSNVSTNPRHAVGFMPYAGDVHARYGSVGGKRDQPISNP